MALNLVELPSLRAWLGAHIRGGVRNGVLSYEKG